MGSMIGAIFGLIYVETNAGSLPLPAPAALRVAGAAAFVGLVVLLVAFRGRPHPPADRPQAGGFGPGYWLVVTGEAVAIVAGSAILTGPLGLPGHGVVAWVSVVVGVHFLSLAAIWRMRPFCVLGAAIAACGIAGLLAAGVAASATVIAAVGGVAPGVLLFTLAYWEALKSASAGQGQPLRQ